MNSTALRTTVTICALIATVAHLTVPALKLDPISLALIVIAILPWLAPLFKSIEIHGVGKIEMQDIQRVQEKAEEIGMMPL